MLDGADEGSGLVQAFVGAGVEPGETAPEPLDPKPAGVQISAVGVCGLQLAAVRGGAGAGPAEPAPEPLDPKPAGVQISAVDVCDLKLAAVRGGQAGSDVEDGVIVEVEAGDRPIALRVRRLLLD